MWIIDPNKSQEELDREAIEKWKAWKAAGGDQRPTYPAERVHQVLLELERRFNEIGRADPRIAEELLEQMRQEARP
jgi:hypothetical protein